MKRCIFIFAFISLSPPLVAQTVQIQNLDCPCTEVPMPLYNRQEPQSGGKVDLIIDWKISLDTIFRVENHKTEIYGDLLLSDLVSGKALDITNGELLPYGEDASSKAFDKGDLIIADHKLNNQTYINFISLAKGDTLSSLKSLSGIAGGYKVLRDSIFWGSDHLGLYAYSVNQRKKIWEKSKKGLQRYENYFLSKGNDFGAYYYYIYNNFRTDSTLKKDFYINAADWSETEIMPSVDDLTISSLRGKSIYLTSSDESKYFSVDITTWKANWCISGDWKRSFLENRDELVSVDHTINLTTGDVVMNNEQVEWMQPIIEWGDFYVLKSSEGHGANEHIFLSQKDFKKYYEINILSEEQLPCDLQQAIWEGSFTVSSSDNKDRSVAYFNCNGKTYLLGVRILRDSFKEYRKF
jgi:hypothetical protein